MIKLSLKGFANYMAANSAQQRKILREYKYQDPEGKAKRDYYQNARKFIREYHKDKRDKKWLVNRASVLATQAEAFSGNKKTKLKNNARAIRQYARHFAQRNFEILDKVNLELLFSNVRISVFPDLRVYENNREKIIKLEFVKNEPEEKIIKIMAQALFQAQMQAGLGLTSASVLYLDVPRGTEHRGARMGSRLNREMEAAGENISALWGSI